MGRIIDEDNVISSICSFCDRWDCNYNCQKVQEIRKIPTAQLEQKKEENTAYWFKPTGMMPPEHAGHYECSNCGSCALRDWNRYKIVLSNFCPNCGAKMRLEQ